MNICDVKSQKQGFFWSKATSMVRAIKQTSNAFSSTHGSFILCASNFKGKVFHICT
jgi:hypothetical protein